MHIHSKETKVDDEKMDDSQAIIKKSDIATFLKVWQIFELLGLFLSIPVVFGFSILLTGDSNKIFDFVVRYVLPSIGLFLIIKIIVTVAFFKLQRWALYFNFIQYFIFALLWMFFMALIIFTGKFSILSFLFVAFFLFLSWANLKCLCYPFYNQRAKENKQ